MPIIQPSLQFYGIDLEKPTEEERHGCHSKKGSSSAYVELTWLRNSNKKSLLPVKTEPEIKLHNFAINSTAESTQRTEIVFVLLDYALGKMVSRETFFVRWRDRILFLRTGFSFLKEGAKSSHLRPLPFATRIS